MKLRLAERRYSPFLAHGKSWNVTCCSVARSVRHNCSARMLPENVTDT